MVELLFWKATVQPLLNARLPSAARIQPWFSCTSKLCTTCRLSLFSLHS